MLGFLGGFIAGVIANYFSPAFKRGGDWLCSFFANFVSGDSFCLTGIWIQKFSEPISGDSSDWRDVEERIELKQIGNIVVGNGKDKIENRCFKYKYSIKHDMVYGYYFKKGPKGSIAGSGMEQLILDPRRDKMVGHATWYDADTQKIESSEVVWIKQ